MKNCGCPSDTLSSLLMMRPADRALDELRPRRSRRRGLGRAGARSQSPASPGACRIMARFRVSIDALSPFGRGANAPLAGRTILQIVPPVDAGGDERATLAVTAALAEAGARALVATDSGELASELQAIGGLHRPLSRGDQEPARHDAQYAPPSAHHRLRAGRPRACALALGGLDGGQSLPQGQASAGHFAPWRWRPLAAAHQLRDRRRRGRFRHRAVGIRRPARGGRFSRRSHAPQGRAPGTGSVEACSQSG